VSHVVRNVLARALGRGPETLRAVTPNVGGAFGSKIYDHSTSSRVQMPARPARIWRALHTTHHR
jgi:CO/xanthine dehydrogenase Mo-binding subunit